MARGFKTGGRTTGTQNRATLASREFAAEALEGGPTPLEFMLQVMRGERTPSPLELQAAALAAPFCHPRLAAVAVKVENDSTGWFIEGVREATHAEWEAEARRATIDRPPHETRDQWLSRREQEIECPQ